MSCYFCGWHKGGHSPNCPAGDRAAEARFRKGWDEGKSGALNPSSDEPAFVLGFHRGEVALEEAQNGFDPVHHSY
jgi:hypothetical protein